MKENESFWDSYASDFDAIYGTKNSWINNAINKMFRGCMKILGIDFSERMIEIAQDHVKDSGGIRDLKFEVVNFLEYQPGKKFDFSIMMGFIEYFKNPELVILKALGITTKKILISFTVAGGFLAFQRKLRYRTRCYLPVSYTHLTLPTKRIV